MSSSETILNKSHKERENVVDGASRSLQNPLIPGLSANRSGSLSLSPDGDSRSLQNPSPNRFSANRSGSLSLSPDGDSRSLQNPSPNRFSANRSGSLRLSPDGDSRSLQNPSPNRSASWTPWRGYRSMMWHKDFARPTFENIPGIEFKCDICGGDHLFVSCAYQVRVPPGKTVGPRYRIVCGECGWDTVDGVCCRDPPCAPGVPGRARPKEFKWPELGNDHGNIGEGLISPNYPAPVCDEKVVPSKL